MKGSGQVKFDASVVFFQLFDFVSNAHHHTTCATDFICAMSLSVMQNAFNMEIIFW